jgi:hypothetical protein
VTHFRCRPKVFNPFHAPKAFYDLQSSDKVLTVKYKRSIMRKNRLSFQKPFQAETPGAMKVTAILLLAFVALVAAGDDGPTKISDNNMGDIITVGVQAKAKIDNKIDATMIKVLLEFLNKQKISVGRGGGGDYPNYPPIDIPTFPPIEFPPRT